MASWQDHDDLRDKCSGRNNHVPWELAGKLVRRCRRVQLGVKFLYTLQYLAGVGPRAAADTAYDVHDRISHRIFIRALNIARWINEVQA
eukprot:764634-Hanusia_phi.AAC.7